MTENITKLDELKELADGTDNDDKSRFLFYEALLDTELYLLLEKELEGGIACPNLIETPEDKYALVFDTISRLVDFTGNSSPYLALTGRMVLPMLNLGMLQVVYQLYTRAGKFRCLKESSNYFKCIMHN